MPMATKKRSATVRMDEDGRVVIPKAVRKSLGINGEERYVQLTVEIDVDE